MLATNNKYYLGKSSSASSPKPQYVAALPEVGEEGVMYLVPTGTTRDGYQIYQEFIYHNGDWEAIGAYDVGISPVGIMYVASFDASTNTLNTTSSGN